ncbi:hypothetical protein Y032_0435g1419 [Ancylostoma ceylanicum]|nr:hypothetical protein Y032_0435g1419 [Ancylostoma ceylanicum]
MAGPVHLNPTMGIFDEKLLACDQKIVFGVLSFHIGSEVRAPKPCPLDFLRIVSALLSYLVKCIVDSSRQCICRDSGFAGFEIRSAAGHTTDPSNEWLRVAVYKGCDD